MSEKLKPTWCKHYRTPRDHDSCDAGVKYDSMRGIKFNKRPCFYKNKDRCISCSHQEWPSQEELIVEEKMWDDALSKVTKVEPILVKIKSENKGKDWHGQKPCPVCQGTLTIRHAGCNGHCSVKCSEDGCVSFME